MQAIDIVTVLSNVVGQIGASPALTLTHGTRFEQNKEADNAIFPKVYLDEPLQSREVLKATGNTDVVYPVKMFFADMVEPDATPAQQRTIILQQRTYAKEFLVLLTQAQYNDGRRIFNLSSGINVVLTDVVNLPYDVTLSGVFLEMDLPIINYGTICII
jgi:hypothetical protein